MRVTLLVLSGDPDTARNLLSERLPAAAIQMLTRADIDAVDFRRRLRKLRATNPDVLAVFTERLAWQRGQNAFFVFGSLGGARKTVLFDRHGGWREESHTRSVAASPFRFASEAARSVVAMSAARKKLHSLERAVENESSRIENHHAASHQPRIVYLRSSPGPGTQAGGAASHINGFINAALQLGADVSLISNDEIAGMNSSVSQTIIPPAPVGTTRAAFDIYNNFRFSDRALPEISNQQPDLIYQRYARFSWAGVEAAARMGIPLFLEYNGSEVWVGRYWDRVDKLDLLARFERLNLKAAARILVVSEVERENLLRAGVNNEKLVLNPNGVDVDRFKPGVSGERVRNELGISADEIVVGFVGTFGPWHGVEVLAQAITQMPQHPVMRFVLVGSGALRSRVEDILRERQMMQHVIFTGAISHDRVPLVLDACDILVSPHVPLKDGSAFFGSPTKLFEYMAMGKAIVASRLGQIGEVLAHEETALLVEPGNAGELVRAIQRLSHSRELREQLGAAARREAVAKHTWKQNAQRVLDEYSSVSGRAEANHSLRAV